jgi:Mg-chelatase subunit ChlD
VPSNTKRRKPCSHIHLVPAHKPNLGAIMLKKWTLFVLTFLSLLPLGVDTLADDVIKTEHGANLKVIVRYDTAIFSEPDPTSRSQPLRQFEFFFALPVDDSGEKTKDGFYRLATGTSEASFVGWAKQEDVVEWPHSEVVGFTKRAERESAHFFETPEHLSDYLKSGSTKLAISREPEGVEVRALLPIMGEATVEMNGESIKRYEVAYMHSGDEKNVVVQDESITKSVLQREITLDVVFVIDTTSSMQPYIDASKEVIRKIASAVNANQNIKGRVRLGLVGYRDQGDEYISKVLCSLEAGTNLNVFEESLTSAKAEGGGDTPEQVYAGLMTAVTEINWNDIANRHIILIGDAPNHEDDNSIGSLEGVLAAAQPTASAGDLQALSHHITIHALQVGDNAGEQRETCRRQFSTLASGRDFAGNFATDGSVANFMERLISALTNRIADTENTIKGEFEKVTSSKDPHQGPLGAILENLGREKVIGQTFASGYVSEVDSKGNRTVEPYVLVGRNDLRAFKSALEYCVTTLENAGEPGSKDVPKILNSLKTLTLHLGYGEEITATTPLKDIMQLILGLPVRASCFDMTPERLAAMSQKDFDAWVKQVDASHAMVESHIEKAHWFNLGKETKLEQRFAFLRVIDLP